MTIVQAMAIADGVMTTFQSGSALHASANWRTAVGSDMMARGVNVIKPPAANAETEMSGYQQLSQAARTNREDRPQLEPPFWVQIGSPAIRVEGDVLDIFQPCL